jgi:hypothetical protein
MDLKILIDNYKCKEGSFIYYLHEEATFNEEAFKKYLSFLFKLSKKGDNQNKEVTSMIVYTYGYTLRSLIYHFHKYDCYEIKNYPGESIVNDYVETMRIIIEECYFNGKEIDPKMLDVELYL